jgi:hypothetical protein
MGNIYRSILKSGIVPYGKKEITINSLETVTEDVLTELDDIYGVTGETD